MTPTELRAYQGELDAKAARMRGLLQLEEWRAFLTHLDGRIEETTERMIQGEAEKFSYYKGVIEGLRAAKSLPTLVIARAEAGNANR